MKDTTSDNIKGPWRAKRRPGSFSSSWYIVDANGSAVANLETNQLDPAGVSHRAGEERAHLIAAAPAMAEALRKAQVRLCESLCRSPLVDGPFDGLPRSHHPDCQEARFVLGDSTVDIEPSNRSGDEPKG